MRTLFLIKEPLLVEGLSMLLSKMVNDFSLKVAQDEKEGEILRLISGKSFDLFGLNWDRLGRFGTRRRFSELLKTHNPCPRPF